MIRHHGHRVLITGGAGFAGSHLAEHHVRAGDEVIVLDNFSTGSRRNLQHVSGTGRLHVAEGCVSDRGLVCDLMSRVDLAYHLAAVVGVKRNLNYPAEAMRVHLAGTHEVFGAASKFHVRMLFTSTSEVYGARTHVPFREEDPLLIGPPTHRRYAYAVSKLADEFLALSLHHTERLPITVVRLFNVTGPRQPSCQGMVIPTFIDQAISGKPITVYGDGTQRRTFCHVANAVEALVALASDDRTVGQVYNLGSTEETSVLRLAYLIRARCGSSSDVRHIGANEVHPDYVDMPRRVPDLSRLRTVLPQFNPMPLIDLIDDAIRHYGTYSESTDVNSAKSCLV